MTKEKTYTADGFDEAIVGIDSSGDVPRIVYSIERMIEILCEKYGWDEEESSEFVSFNVMGAHLGEGTPLYIHTMTLRKSMNIFLINFELLWTRKHQEKQRKMRRSRLFLQI